MKKHFLSLTEMLVVVGIIILLFSIGVPAVIKGMQRGELTECKGNLSQLGKAVSVYLKDNQNYYPVEGSGDWIGSSADPISEYIGGSLSNINSCPADPSEANSYRASADGNSSDFDLDATGTNRGLKSSKIERPKLMSLFVSKEVYDNLDSSIGETWHGTDGKAIFPFVNVGGSVTNLTFTDSDLDIVDITESSGTTYPSSKNGNTRVDFKNYYLHESP